MSAKKRQQSVCLSCVPCVFQLTLAKSLTYLRRRLRQRCVCRTLDRCNALIGWHNLDVEKQCKAERESVAGAEEEKEITN